MVLKRHPKVRAALIEAQEARARRLEIQADLVASKYVELMERALEAKDFTFERLEKDSAHKNCVMTSLLKKEVLSQFSHLKSTREKWRGFRNSTLNKYFEFGEECVRKLTDSSESDGL